MKLPGNAATFEELAQELIDRGHAAKTAPYLTRLIMLGELANDVPFVVLGMAKELDRLRALHPSDGPGPVAPAQPANTNAAPAGIEGKAA